MENLNKLFSEMMAKDNAYLKAEMDLRNSCINLLNALPFDKNGEWYFNEDNEPIIGEEECFAVRGVRVAADTITLIPEDIMANEMSVDDLIYVARMARNEIAMRN